MIETFVASFERYKARMLERPFWRLVSHFGLRLFAAGDAGEGELNLGIGAILALLASPGGFISILLFNKYSSLLRWVRGQLEFDPYPASLGDQYFFFAFSVAITGIVTVLKWDSIFPDRRDYANLAPLPIPARTIFLANITAIVALAVIFAIDVNMFSSVLFSMDVTINLKFHDFLAFGATHVIGVLLASLFTFFALFAIIGLLMVVLPEAAFRRASIYVRVGVVTALLLLLCYSFAVMPMLTAPAGTRGKIFELLPPVWFLGLSRALLHRADPDLARLGLMGLKLTGLAVITAASVYVLSYYRHFIRLPEMLETTTRRNRSRTWDAMGRLTDRLMLRTPFERAEYRFAMKTLLRSDRHLLFFGGFAGLGVVIASQTLASAVAHPAAEPGVPGIAILSLPFIISYTVICGLRFVFDLPAELRANWVHQAIVDYDQHAAAPLARKIMLSFVWPWQVLVALPLYALYFGGTSAGWSLVGWNLAGWTLAAGHTAVVMSASFCLASVLLRRYRKLPFTCAYSAWKQNATVMVVLYALGFLLICTTVPEWERRLLRHSPWLLWLLAALLFAAWKLYARFRYDELDETHLLFEDAEVAEYQWLNLQGR